VCVMGGIALFIYQVLERERKIEAKEKSTLSEYESIIKKAHDQAAELLDKTKTASNKLVSEATNTGGELEKTLDSTLKAMADKHTQSLIAEAGMFRKDYEDKILQMQNAINQEVTKTLQTFTQSLLTKTTSAEELVSEKTNELMEAANNEIEKHKKERLEKIDEEIIQMVQKISNEILGLTIPPELHRELIVKALEKSKAEGVFDI